MQITEEHRQALEQIDSYRAHLRSVTDFLDALLEEGRFPAKGRSADDLAAFEQWWETRHNAVKAARQMLAHPDEAPQARI